MATSSIIQRPSITRRESREADEHLPEGEPIKQPSARCLHKATSMNSPQDNPSFSETVTLSNMSLTNNALLPALYIGLSTPANSRPPSPLSPPNGFCDGVDLSTGLLGLPALLAKSLLTDTSHAGQTSLVRADPMAPDSLSRSRMGELPVLEHILSVGGGNPLCLGGWR